MINLRKNRCNILMKILITIKMLMNQKMFRIISRARAINQNSQRNIKKITKNITKIQV